MLKSQNSDTPVSVAFINNTKRRVDLFWVDFNGKFVRYRNGLNPGLYYAVHTYETHPWIAKDSKTGANLLIKGSFVYNPQLDENRMVQSIYITLPVYRLVERCLDVLRSHGVESKSGELEIPGTLKQELQKSQLPTYTEYTQRRQ